MAKAGPPAAASKAVLVEVNRNDTLLFCFARRFFSFEFCIFSLFFPMAAFISSNS
jgi:hypothetical protein